ncbi:SNARE-like superfamily protein [Striga hermonthica]|uniref:SNARE-like superfamily protein n=1 Tax=Striga hermonthica TaxID=68872 RepID=A0A9N7R4D4_STRHE|nr:SNARE-like superfamily protein [Striga hermonthica]
MIPNPDLIHYACIARGATVLAEFNSRDAALGAVAARCLLHAPPHHAAFSHTVRSRTYSFLIDAPFVYFAISDDRLETSEGQAFLRNVRDTFRRVSAAGGRRKLERLSSHCFQGEFNPVFRQLLGPALYHTDGIGSPSPSVGGSGSGRVGRGLVADQKAVRKMKNRLLGKFNGEKENDENGGNGIGLSREFSLVVNKNGELYPVQMVQQHQKARKIWKKHVWVVLSLDVIICLILFGVWLWVCSGLQCMES